MLVLVVAGWVAGWLLAADVRRLREAPGPGGPAPRVSVVVPARDEAGRLPALLRALAAAEPAPAEVIVVDDGSTDATAAVAAAGGARVLASEAPPGWTGKAHACWTGARAAAGDVLAFLDADVVPEPGTLGALGRAAARSGGLVSVQPAPVAPTPAEGLSAACNLVAVLSVGTGAPRPGWRRPVAFGPAVAIPRQAYLACGGHAADPGSIVDDLALATTAHRAGLPVAWWLAPPGTTYRMYPDGLRPLVAGWSKNLAAGATAVAPLRLVAAVAWVTAALAAGLFALGGPAPWRVAAYAAFAGQVGILTRRVGRFPAWTWLAYPLPLAAFVGLTARSQWLRRVRGRAAWRGRDVALRGGPR